MVKVSRIDGKYYLTVDDNDLIELVVKQPNGWAPTIFLPENPTGRKLINQAVADKKLDASEDGSFELTVKPERAPMGSRGPAIPNKKLAEFLKRYDVVVASITDEGVKEELVALAHGMTGDELYAEFTAITDRAVAKANESKAKPKTDVEKAQARFDKAKAALEALLNGAAEGDDTTTVPTKSRKNKGGN